MSPEIALSDRFRRKVLQDQTFQQHLVLVAIDKLHIVSEWGQHWRNSYSQLALLRGLIDRTVPWLGCSATIDPVMLEEIRALCDFDPTVRIQRISIDRPDIKFTIQPIQHPMTTFHDLEFLVEPAKATVMQITGERAENMVKKVFKSIGDKEAAQAIISAYIQQEKMEAGSSSRTCCKAIPKTIVYIDSIMQIESAVKILRSLLIQGGCLKTDAMNAIQAYHSELTDFNKEAISIEFTKPDVESVLESSKHHIIVTTDVMGMGIDNPDVRLVVQWKQPPSMCALIQRAGQAARGRTIHGEFIWLAEAWCWGLRKEDITISHQPASQEPLSKNMLTERQR